MKDKPAHQMKTHPFYKHPFPEKNKIKLEIDLTPKMSSQLQCGFIQVQTVSHLLLLWFSVTPLAQ